MILHKDDAREPSPSGAVRPTPLLLLAPNEQSAPIAILSPTNENALIACFNAGGLRQKGRVLGMVHPAARRYTALRLPTLREMEC